MYTQKKKSIDQFDCRFTHCYQILWNFAATWFWRLSLSLSLSLCRSLSLVLSLSVSTPLSLECLWERHFVCVCEFFSHISKNVKNIFFKKKYFFTHISCVWYFFKSQLVTYYMPWLESWIFRIFRIFSSLSLSRSLAHTRTYTLTWERHFVCVCDIFFTHFEKLSKYIFQKKYIFSHTYTYTLTYFPTSEVRGDRTHTHTHTHTHTRTHTPSLSHTLTHTHKATSEFNNEDVFGYLKSRPATQFTMRHH